MGVNSYSLSSVDKNGIQRLLTDYSDVTYSNTYSSEGGGFGFMSFTLARKPGVSYEDIGYGYKLELIKGLKLYLFKGIVTQISEQGESSVKIGAVGEATLYSFELANFVLADNRVNKWITGCDPKGSFRPDKFDHSYSWSEIINEGMPSEEEVGYDGIEILPKRGMDYNQDDYYYLRYRFEFGETARVLTATYKLNLPNNWPGRVQILDANANVIWQLDVSGNGTLNLDLDALYAGNFVEVRFIVRIAGLSTTEDVYFRMWNVQVSSTNTSPDCRDVVLACAQIVASAYGLSTDYSLIQTIGYAIPQAAYDTDMQLNTIINQATQYGTSTAYPVAWGVKPDGSGRTYLEPQNLSSVLYRLHTFNDSEVSGDLTDSYQRAYAKYTDPVGQTKRTATLSATEEIAALGLYKKVVLDFDEIPDAQVTQALTVALNESRAPAVSTGFTVQDYVENVLGGQTPVDEIKSGGLVQVPRLKAKEVNVLTDKREGFHTFMLASVEVNLDSRTATLSPGSPISDFDRYMTLIRRNL